MKFLKKNNLGIIVFIVFFSLFGIGMCIYHLRITNDSEGALSGILMPLFLLIPPLCYRIFRIRPVRSLTWAIYIFSFLAFGLGVAARLYRLTDWYDKIVHFCSGYFFTMIGMGIFYYLKKDKVIEPDKDCALSAWLSGATSFFIAVIWEIFEYTDSLLIPGHDPQRVAATGVGDTMTDLIASSIGAVFAVVFIVLYYKKKIKGPLLKVLEDYFQINILKS